MITHFRHKYKKKEHPSTGSKKEKKIRPVWLFVFSNANCPGIGWSFYVKLKCESEPSYNFFLNKKKNFTVSLRVKLV